MAELAVGESASGTELVIASGKAAEAQAGDIVKVWRTGELLRVTAVGAERWTVLRAIGNRPAKALISGDDLIVLFDWRSPRTVEVANG